MPSSAKEGCRRCFERRIACDQSLPGCRKCFKKGLECPGYGRQLRWTNAVAVRGHLKGRREPVVASSSTAVEPPRPGGGNEVPAGPGPSPEDLIHDAEASLRYFNTHIAPMMVWVDSARNEYKKLESLAQSQPVLMRSIQAVSAAHLTADTALADAFCNDAVTMMTAMIRPMLAPSGPSPKRDALEGESAEALLASMLILSSHSLIAARPAEAQAHRQAARILTMALSERQRQSPVRFRFLKNQLSLYETLACTTLFNAEDVKDAIVSDYGPEEVFSDYMKVLHRVTLLSCRGSGTDGAAAARPSIDAVESELELATGSTLLAAGPLLRGHSNAFVQDFTRLAYLYQHAGVVYAYDRLGRQGDVSAHKRSSERIFSLLGSFHDTQPILQNLPWPAFIGGTAAGGDVHKQKAVRDIFQALSASTRFKHYLAILDFLEQLWLDPSRDWMELAASWHTNNSSIIAL